MSKNAQTNWDDLRVVVAVAEHGSVAAAARVLEVNHATVLRRIAAFEERQRLHGSGAAIVEEIQDPSKKTGIRTVVKKI